MTTNSHESDARAMRYAQHIRDLAQAFHVILRVDPTRAPDDAGAGWPVEDDALPFNERRKMAGIPPVVDETTYAVALHELGHVLHPMGQVTQTDGSRTLRLTNRAGTTRDVALRLIAERAAWEWAHHFALEFTPAMQSVENMCLGGYERDARRILGYVPGGAV